MPVPLHTDSYWKVAPKIQNRRTSSRVSCKSIRSRQVKGIPAKRTAVVHNCQRSMPTGVRNAILHLRSSGGFYGAEQVILNLSRELDTLGCTNHILCLNNAQNPHLELIERAKKANVSAFAVDCRGRFDRQAVATI